MRVAVVGGGVVGLCIAEALALRGADVVVLEAGALGAAASAGNGGWVTPGISNPLPAPGTMPQALRWMLDRRSPLLVRPVPRTSFARWLFDFWRNTRPRRYSAGMAALVALSQRTIADFDALAGRCSFEMHNQGLLFVGRSEATLAAQLEVFNDQQRLGYQGQVSVLDRAAALAHEPALSEDVAGAIHAVDERHVRPESLTAGVAAGLRAAGAELREETAVRGVSRAGDGWSLDCGGERLEADGVVLAGGVETAKLLAPLGVRLPLEGAKGYSLTMDDPPMQLRGPVYLLESKVGLSPFERALRLAGTLELGTRGLGLNSGRVASIEDAGQRALRGWNGRAEWRGWAGFRPLLPDGLPAIGPVPGHRGLHVATGHAMLGVTLAPTTAALLAPVVLDGKPSLELAPFSIARFDNRGGRAIRPTTEERT